MPQPPQPSAQSANPLTALAKAEHIGAGPSEDQELGRMVFEGLMQGVAGALPIPTPWADKDSKMYRAGELAGAAAPLLKAVPMLASPGRLKWGSAGMKPSNLPIDAEEFGLTPADFGVPNEKFDIGDPRTVSRKISTQFQLRGGGNSGLLPDASKVAEIGKGRPVLEVMPPKPVSGKFLNNLDAHLKREDLPFNTGTMSRSRTQLPNNASSKIDDAMLGQIRHMGNNTLADLPVRKAARQVKTELGLNMSDQAITDILKGSSFVRRGMIVRPE